MVVFNQGYSFSKGKYDEGSRKKKVEMYTGCFYSDLS